MSDPWLLGGEECMSDPCVWGGEECTFDPWVWGGEECIPLTLSAMVHSCNQGELEPLPGGEGGRG